MEGGQTCRGGAGPEEPIKTRPGVEHHPGPEGGDSGRGGPEAPGGLRGGVGLVARPLSLPMHTGEYRPGRPQ